MKLKSKLLCLHKLHNYLISYALKAFLIRIAFNLATSWVCWLLRLDHMRSLQRTVECFIQLAKSSSHSLLRLQPVCAWLPAQPVVILGPRGLAVGQAETAQLFWHLIMARLTGAWHFVAARTERTASTAGDACQTTSSSPKYPSPFQHCVYPGQSRQRATKATQTTISNVLNPVVALLAGL